MTVTSTNHNPGNESKYARHRSIWKGRHNQLRDTIARLQGTPGIKVFEYSGKNGRWEFSSAWNVRFQANREPPTKRSQIMGRWSVDPPSEKMLGVLGDKLRADLSLLWDDFIIVTARRIGKSDGAGHDVDPKYTGDTVVVFAYGPTSFDLIVSKYGFGDGNKRNHHFFHWQARTKGHEGLVHVDDYEGEEGLTFYVVS